MKIYVKITLAFLLICLVPLITITIFTNLLAKETISRQILNHLESVASIQHARIHMVVDKYHERLTLVSSKTELRISLDKYIKGKNRFDQEEMKRNLLDTRSALNGFQNIDILSPDGEVVTSTNEEKIGANHVNEEFFVRGLVEQNIDMLFLDENRNLKVHFSGPIFMEDKLIGVVVIEATTRSIISMVKDYSGLGETGETLLAKRDENGDALFITPLRFDADAVLSKRVSKEALELPITQALLGNEQLFTDSIDYRGEPVLAATRYVEDMDWGLVVKIDKAEAFAPVAGLRNSLILITVIASIAILFVSLYTARNITRPITVLTRTAIEISGGNLSRRVEVTSKDEIGLLAQSFNQMTKNLTEARDRLEKKVKQRTAKLEKEIADHKQAEEELREKEEFNFALFQHSPIQTIVVDHEGRVIKTNMAKRKSGDKVPSIGDVMYKDYAVKHEIDMHSELMKCIKNGRTKMFPELKYDDKFLNISIASFPKGAIITSQDITEQKQAEKEQERLQAQLIHSEKMAGIGTLASGIAHEFNNLIHIMRGHAEFAQSTKKAEDTEEALDVVLKTSDEVAKIVGDLLTFAREEPSKKEKESSDITESIEGVFSLMEEYLRKQNIDIVRKYGRTPRIEMNKGQMQQVFLNIVNNARDAMLPKGGKLEIETKQLNENIEVSISDTGKGIEKENLDKLFEPFYTTKRTDEEDNEFQGTGLGLSVSYGIVKRHGGTIKVRSNVNKGSTFIINLPLKEKRGKNLHENK